jgi:glutathione S-transferase
MGGGRWREMGLASGLLDGAVTWLRATASPEPQPVSAVVARETTQVNRAADALEIAVANGAYMGPMSAAQIVLGTALGLVELRLPVWTWREKRARLSAWNDTIAMRPSFQATMPPPL